MIKNSRVQVVIIMAIGFFLSVMLAYSPKVQAFTRLANEQIENSNLPLSSDRLIHNVDGDDSLVAQASSLTGIWSCDDGGIYYVRQLGNVLWWHGDGGSGFSNVLRGTISGNRVVAQWADLPGGRTGSSGQIVLQVSPNRMVALSRTGGFGGVEWTR
jgi:hypothetical protein